MIFYEIEAKKATECKVEKKRITHRELAAVLADKSEAFFLKNGKQSFFFVFAEQSNSVSFGAILKENSDPLTSFREYSKLLPFNLEEPTVEETTFHTISSKLSLAERVDFIREKDCVLEQFELDHLEQFYNFSFGENLVAEESPKQHLETAKRHLFTETFAPELERILTPPCKKGAVGHPVHYLIRTDHRESRKEICRTLLSALYVAGRIQNKRYAFWDYREEDRLPEDSLAALYTSCKGGALVIRLEGSFSNEGKFASRGRDGVKKLVELAEQNRKHVLTVFCSKKSCETAKDLLYKFWSASPLIELCEGNVSKTDALLYLKSKAKSQKTRADQALTETLEKEGKSFSKKDLDRIFDAWYDKKLRTGIYPQYAFCKTTKAEIKEEKVRGSSYDKLQAMIGLKEAKDMIDQAISYFKMQKIFAERGFASESPSMHMIFTGNPGTAKTTVARLFAEIMKENGLLKTGTLYEVGRGDLVGKYVGSTAPLVKEAFEQAKGGVLFIDEAYALVDDRDGLFGDEAINTITQEMENNRKDTVVIFAGYPDKMEGFLKKNPGLRSRIAFHLNFRDYSADELCRIADHIASCHGLTLEESARTKLCAIFQQARENNDFGNGRFARNLVEKAKMAQAQRLMKKDLECITDYDLTTLRAEDFEVPPLKKAPRSAPIGYIA